MSTFMRMFDVFSARPEASTKPTHDIPSTTRNRVLRWVVELYTNKRFDLGVIGRGDYNGEFWDEKPGCLSLFAHLLRQGVP